MKVKVSVIVVLSIISGILTINKDLSKITTLRAVTELDEETYYGRYSLLRANSNNKSLPEDPSEVKIKLKLCKEIFTSSYFQWSELEWIDIDRNVQDQLYASNKFLFSKIFKESDDGDSYEYRNPYSYGGYAFICLVSDTKSKEILHYYVGREYNINEVSGGLPIAGRFVYTDYFHPCAIAEEPAMGSESKYRALFEYHYMRSRLLDVQREWSKDVDPVCKLTPNFKLRLCVTLFTSESLRHQYKFIPKKENVEIKCKKIRVSFLAQLQAFLILSIRKLCIDKTRIYEEWMMACNAVSIRDNIPVSYLVSRGNAKNTVFVYKEKFNDGKVFLQQYFTNVSVVDDIGSEVEGTQVKGNNEN